MIKYSDQVWAFKCINLFVILNYKFQKIWNNFNNVINMTGLIRLYDNFIMYGKKIKKMESNIQTTYRNK